MALHDLLLFLAAAFAVTLAPGPDILTVLARSLAQGRQAGVVAALGFATGLIVHTTAAALGIALLLKESPHAYLAVRWAGILYLLYLAFQMLRDKTATTPGPTESRALARIYGQSILMNILNPKVTLFFFAFLPQFVNPNALLPVALQFVILGALFAGVTILCFCGVVLAAAPLTATLRHSPTSVAPLRYVVAVLFLLLALRLAIS